MSDIKLTTITVDGLSVETTDAGAQAISKLTQDLSKAQKASDDLTASHKTELAAKDTELATKDAEIDTLKGKQLSDEDIDKRVNDRADLIATAKGIADKDYTGKSAFDIRKMAVTAVLGQDSIDGKSDDYVQARFDILSEDESQDGVRKVLKSGEPKGNVVDNAHAAMVSGMQDAWKGGTA